jgi:hypothetical protein
MGGLIYNEVENVLCPPEAQSFKVVSLKLSCFVIEYTAMWQSTTLPWLYAIYASIGNSKGITADYGSCHDAVRPIRMSSE